MNNKIWRCDLKSPCVKLCESKNNKHQCGVRRKDKMGKLKIATLFSGIGTPEQSLKHLGIEHETIFACEINKYARVTYLANNDEPNTFYDDVYNIDGKKYLNQIDILIGGSPCQSFSIAGKRLGTSCPRGNLIYEYFRIVEESQPKVFIYENVKGFLSINKGETFENFKNSFKEIGYTVYHQVLNTKDYGIPQNRERIYIVGFKDNVDFSFQEKQELKLKLKDMLEESVDSKYLLNQELVEKYIQTGTASNHKGSQAGKVADETDEHFWTVNAGTHGYSMGYVKTINPVCVDANGRQSNESTGAIISTYHRGMEKYGSRPFIRLNQSHKYNVETHECRKRIYSVDGLAPTISAASGGYHEPKVSLLIKEEIDPNAEVVPNNYIFRKLTPRECFRLQGFDNTFIFPEKMSDTQLYKQAGNGMSRNILEMIFTQIFTCYTKYIEEKQNENI